ncbi:MarR family winged helix-turn-helix transcriptional regulator [Leifsonia sp. AG29]|uniref:MarR family winged helix-turn-helix transcriptional regulator n=1 Tax=Leifsonia sp. AG29 TaxID=2598860 RepID=UPI00131EBB91|nr:MarR family winged helix-turn-helix transcriptional regulator [Leifsonia sp. AG29]
MRPAHDADERPATGADDDVPGRLALAVGRLNRRLRSSTGGLSHGQLSALSTIVRQGPLRPSEIAAVEKAAAPTITRVVSDLEARGLVSRAPDPADGRSFFVSGTEAGQRLLLEARSDRARAVSEILAELRPDQVEALRAALPALEDAAQVPHPPKR